MKKFTAVLVMTAMLCSFVSCGNDIADEIESSVTSVAEETTEESSEPETVEFEEEPTEETTEEITEPETEEISKISVEGTEEYAEVIESLFECARNNDVDGIIDLCYPDKYCDTIRLLNKMDLYDGLYNWINSIDYGFVSIDSVEPVSEEYIPYFNAYYRLFQPAYEYIEKNGTKNPDKDELSKIMSTPVPESLDIYFNIEKAVTVNTTISRDIKEDDPDFENIIDYEFDLYYIDGEGWKLDFITMGHLYEAERSMVLDELRNLYSASETVLTGLTETGAEIPENCIICSDSSRNYNVTDEFLNTFDNSLEECYQKKDGFDYFVMINDGELACVSGQYATKPKFYRAYPTEYFYDEDDYKDGFDYFVMINNVKLACVSGQYAEKPRFYQAYPTAYFYDEDDYVVESYDERYNLCLDRMKNNQPQSYMKH